MTVKVVSFDLDGTLVKNNFVERFWFGEVPEMYSEVHGIEFQESLRRVKKAYKEVGPEDIRWYQPAYWFERFDLNKSPEDVVEDMTEEVEYFNDALNVLDSLAEPLDLVVITNSPRIFAEVQLERISDFFSKIYSCPSDLSEIKNKSGVYLQVCEDLGIEPFELIHVGDDSFHDYEVPEKVGINSFIVDRAREDGSEYKLTDLRDLLDVI